MPNCRASKDVICRHCKKKGHMERACRAKRRKAGKNRGTRKNSSVGKVDLGKSDSEEEEDEDTLYLHCFKSRGITRTLPIIVKVKVDDCIVPMEVDTGASLSLMSHSKIQELWSGRSLLPTKVRLQSYSKSPIPVVGSTNVDIYYNGQRGQFPFIIVEGKGPALLGRDWLSKISLDWRSINHIQSSSLQTVISRYPAVFPEGLGTFKGFHAQIYPNAQPKFYPARSVPYALRDLVDKEIDRLVTEGTWSL